MPREVCLIIMIKRTGGRISLQVSKKTKIRDIIARVCDIEQLPMERYQLVLNENRIILESETVKDEGLSNLKPTDRLVLTMKASYLYIELQALSMMREQRIMGLITKNRAEAQPIVAQPVRTLAEVIKSVDLKEKVLNRTRIHTTPTSTESSVCSAVESKESSIPESTTLVEENRPSDIPVEGPREEKTEPDIAPVIEIETIEPEKTVSAHIVEEQEKGPPEEEEEEEEEKVEVTKIKEVTEIPEVVTEESNNPIAEKTSISSTGISVVEHHNSTTEKSEATAKQNVMMDLEGIAHGIEQFPKGLVQDYIHSSLTEFNVMLIGAPGTGKRSLISSICGIDIERTPSLADVSVDDCQSYTIENSYRTEKKVTKCDVKFWFTPGITSWSDANIQQYIDKIKTKQNLMCMIFCASPNSFASPDQIRCILNECVKAGIFSAFVVTNMYAGPASDELLEMFKEMLAAHSNVTEVNDSITYYGNIGLCTKVNSSTFVAQDGEEYPMEGVDELILGISKSLTKEKAIGWGLTIIENGPFWLRKHVKIFNLLDNLKSVISPNL